MVDTLWADCDVLRDDGVRGMEDIEQLTYPLSGTQLATGRCESWTVKTM